MFFCWNFLPEKKRFFKIFRSFLFPSKVWRHRWITSLLLTDIYPRNQRENESLYLLETSSSKQVIIPFESSLGEREKGEREERKKHFKSRLLRIKNLFPTFFIPSFLDCFCLFFLHLFEAQHVIPCLLDWRFVTGIFSLEKETFRERERDEDMLMVTGLTSMASSVWWWMNIPFIFSWFLFFYLFTHLCYIILLQKKFLSFQG